MVKLSLQFQTTTISIGSLLSAHMPACVCAMCDDMLWIQKHHVQTIIEGPIILSNGRVQRQLRTTRTSSRSTFWSLLGGHVPYACYESCQNGDILARRTDVLSVLFSTNKKGKLDCRDACSAGPLLFCFSCAYRPQIGDVCTDPTRTRSNDEMWTLHARKIEFLTKRPKRKKKNNK